MAKDSKVIKIARAGEGGQGVQSSAEILAEAANEGGKNALYIPNFGVEQRGGVSIAFVQISDGEIGAPKFQKADILIPLSPRAVDRTQMHAGSDTIYIYDNSLITEAEVGDNIVGMQYFDVTPMCPTDSSTQQELLPGETRTCSFTKPSPGIDPAKLPKVKKLVAIPANDIAKTSYILACSTSSSSRGHLARRSVAVGGHQEGARRETGRQVRQQRGART
jgi:2-oxoglutarate ferredoxin oxidoreductase subunit gamma